MSKPTKPAFPVSRIKQGKTITPAVISHAARVGEVVTGMNDVQLLFLAIFSYLVDQQDTDPATAIWLTITSDRTQREMLKSLAAVRMKKHKRHYKSLVWAINSANSLSEYRNAYAHVPVYGDVESQQIVHANPFASKESHANALKTMATKTNFKKLTGDLTQLENYLSSFYFHLTYPVDYALPKRPALRLIPPKKNTSQQKRNRQKPSRPRP